MGNQYSCFCCTKTANEDEQILSEFWDGFKIRSESSKAFIERLEKIFNEKKTLLKSEWIIVINEFFFHETLDMQVIENFFAEAYEYYYSRLHYFLLSLLFVFQANLYEATENFKFFFTDVFKNKRSWCVTNQSLLIDLDEIKSILNVYVDLISAFTIKILQDSKLKKISKFYEHSVQKSLVSQIIISIKPFKKEEYVDMNNFLKLHYYLLSESRNIRVKLEEIYIKIFEAKVKKELIEKNGKKNNDQSSSEREVQIKRHETKKKSKEKSIKSPSNFIISSSKEFQETKKTEDSSSNTTPLRKLSSLFDKTVKKS